LKEILGNRSLIIINGFVAFKPFGEVISVIKNFLDSSGHGITVTSTKAEELLTGSHGVNDELNSFGSDNTDFKESGCSVRADEHGEIIKHEHSDWIAVGVQNVFVVDTVLTSTVENHGIHPINLP
jgi:hypothetical protein